MLLMYRGQVILSIFAISLIGKRSTGVLEYWSIALKKRHGTQFLDSQIHNSGIERSDDSYFFAYGITPTLQHSNTPTLHERLQYFSQGLCFYVHTMEGISESLRLTPSPGPSGTFMCPQTIGKFSLMMLSRNRSRVSSPLARI